MIDTRWNHKIIKFDHGYEVRIWYYINAAIDGSPNRMSMQVRLYLDDQSVSSAGSYISLEASPEEVAYEENKSISYVLNDRKQKVSQELTYLMELTEGYNDD